MNYSYSSPKTTHSSNKTQSTLHYCIIDKPVSDQTLDKPQLGSEKISFPKEAEQLVNCEIGVEGQLSKGQERNSQSLGRTINRVDQVCQTA